MRRILTGLALAAVSFSMTGAAAEALTIAVFTKNNSNPAYAAARRGADLVAAEHGARTVHYVPEKPDDVEQQKALLAKALADKPDLVLFVPVDDKAMVEDVKKLTDAGIPVVTFVNALQGDFVAHVGSDDVAVGYKGAKALFDALGGRGKVFALEGNPAAPTSRDRVSGLRQALAEYPDIELLELATGMYLQQPAHEVTAAALGHHAEIDGIWAANDVMVYGALDALDEAGREAKLVGANGLAKAIELIETGTMLASVEFSAFKIACAAAQAGLRHLDGRPVPTKIMVPVVLIEKSNLAPWKVPLDQRTCPPWEEVAG